MYIRRGGLNQMAEGGSVDPSYRPQLSPQVTGTPGWSDADIQAQIAAQAAAPQVHYQANPQLTAAQIAQARLPGYSEAPRGDTIPHLLSSGDPTISASNLDIQNWFQDPANNNATAIARYAAEHSMNPTDIANATNTGQHTAQWTPSNITSYVANDPTLSAAYDWSGTGGGLHLIPPHLLSSGNPNSPLVSNLDIQNWFKDPANNNATTIAQNAAKWGMSPTDIANALNTGQHTAQWTPSNITSYVANDPTLSAAYDWSGTGGGLHTNSPLGMYRGGFVR